MESDSENRLLVEAASPSTLSVVYVPESSSAAPAVDIVAVHGLGGDPTHTWTSSRSNSFWLRDFLPQQIPNARILTYGYNATAAFTHSTTGLLDEAEGLLAALKGKREEIEEDDRPLIFIAHSLGGILVKQALILAHSELKHQSIFHTVCGIFFFGTPNRGSEATCGQILASIAKEVLRPVPRSGKAFQVHGAALLRVNSDFHLLPASYDLMSLFELESTKSHRGLIVKQFSAILGVENEDVIAVDEDHSTICKFETVENLTYNKVYRKIMRMMRKQSQQDKATHPTTVNKVQSSDVFHRTVPIHTYFEVPHLLSSVFTGRDETLQRLDALLVLEKRSHPPLQRRYALYGPGGSGKTQICLRYWGIFWIDASTQESIKQSMMQIASRLRVGSDITSVKRKLAEVSLPWLLVFNKADDPELSLTPYFPMGDRGDIIITSRWEDCRRYCTVGAEKIKEMDRGDAVILLSKIAFDSAGFHEKTVERAAQRIVQRLEYFALAIIQAGAYIREVRCSLADYIELHRRPQVQLSTFPSTQLITRDRSILHKTWQISFDKVMAGRDETSRRSLNLLKLLCCYHHEQIPSAMFFQAWRQWSKSKVRTASWLPWSQDAVELSVYRQEFDACVARLASFSLIQRNLDSAIFIHPLVQECCKSQLLREDRLVSCQRAASMLAASIDWKFSFTKYNSYRSLLPHILACYTTYKRIVDATGVPDIAGDNDAQHEPIYPWSTLALVLGENGYAKDGIFLMENMVQIQSKSLGKDHPDTVTSMSNLATQYSNAGRFDEALALSAQVVQLRKTILGEGHPDTLTSMSNLATQYSNVGRFDEALQLSEQVVKLRKSILGEGHRVTLTSMSNLATQYSNVGRFDEALQLSEQVVQLRKSILGERHPDTLTSMSNLAVDYSKSGRVNEALQLSEQVVQLRETILGEEHPETLRSLNNLAIQYGTVGRLTEALQLSEQVLRSYKMKLGKDHPETLISLNNLAIRYNNVGRRSEALQLSEQVVKLNEAKLGKDHPETLNSMNNLAIQYDEAGRLTEARQLLEWTFQMRTTKLGENHPDTLMTFSILKEFLARQGLHEEDQYQKHEEGI